MPKLVSAQVDKEGSMTLSRSPDFTFKTTTSSKILKDAIKRYEPLIIRSDTEHAKCSSQAVEISTVLIILRSDKETLGIDTNYDYELTISSETNDATIVANSPFGAMYVLWVSVCVIYTVFINSNDNYRNLFEKRILSYSLY